MEGVIPVIRRKERTKKGLRVNKGSHLGVPLLRLGIPKVWEMVPWKRERERERDRETERGYVLIWVSTDQRKQGQVSVESSDLVLEFVWETGAHWPCWQKAHKCGNYPIIKRLVLDMESVMERHISWFSIPPYLGSRGLAGRSLSQGPKPGWDPEVSPRWDASACCSLGCKPRGLGHCCLASSLAIPSWVPTANVSLALTTWPCTFLLTFDITVFVFFFLTYLVACMWLWMALFHSFYGWVVFYFIYTCQQWHVDIYHIFIIQSLWRSPKKISPKKIKKKEKNKQPPHKIQLNKFEDLICFIRQLMNEQLHI